ncbi:hypothetical protein HN937_15450, partial [Candidatus Poribacteria bacterium]|nr:hypothetical protein [Candidatus Poribacteria bacterium]
MTKARREIETFTIDAVPSELPFSSATRAGDLVHISGQIGHVPGEMRLGPGVPWRIVHEGEVPVALIDQPLRIVRRFDPIYRRAFRAASPDKPRRHAVRWTSAHGIRIASRFLEAGLWTESVVRDVSRAWKTLWSNGLSFTVVQHRHGYSFINTLEPLADERVDEWERFTDLFAFAYDRYLELRERDARNRELQVQNALERVRAQASGMQQSADLEAVSLTLLETARTLIPTIVRDFVIIDQEGEGQDYWTASLVGGETPTPRPRGQVGVFTAAQTNAARADGASYFPYTETGGPHYDDVYGYRVFHEHGWISFGSTAYLADTDVGVLERLTEVFGFAYQRFLELADKERRAREAEVQVALEKIRAQALSMQGTDDLPALSSALFRELDGLGLPVLQSLISVLHEDRDEFEEWTTVLPGLQDLMDNYGTVHSDLAPAVVHARNSLSWFHVVVPEWAEAWRSWLDYGQDVFTLRWTRAQMRRSGQAYVRRGWWTKQYLKAVLADLPKELDQCLVHYRHGRFVFNLSRSLTDDELGVLRRIADVFCFAYDRFLELQLKEQRAREAEIEVSLERVRARALGMQQSDNLADVTEVLFQELKRLGLDPLHAIIGVDEDDA